MPKDKDSSNHPCHFLSLPSAKRFWCRHCMSVFEDAITRWRHSRSCRYGVVDNFMRRRQLEAKALQNTNKPNPIEARLEQSVSPSEEPIMAEGEGPSSGEKSNQATSHDLFRCFICHNRFSTLEEMRHHVKYPCNNKKIITDVPNPAVTVYIDEFTDRSRQWDPQPQQEEVVTSEQISNIVAQETVQSTVDVGNVIQESTVSSSQNQQSKLTPTNIYVNEQGETVIEVENLDLNSEGGELSLAHLLTQLSQQGIVFDKNKASQMQARQESTMSDPSSGEIFTATASFDPQNIVKEEDEGQPTAEDAANTLAQLSVFRGYRSNPDNTQVTMQIPADIQKEYVVEGTNMGYTYIPSSSDQITIENNENQQNINVEYDYSYLPSNQSTSEGHQISFQSSILDSSPSHLGQIEVVKEHDNANALSSMHFQHNIQPQVVTYISSSSALAQQTQTSAVDEQTMLIENVVVEDQSATTTQHYHMNISEGVRQAASHEASMPANIDATQNSYIVINSNDNSTQIICNPEVNQNELSVDSNSMPVTILNNEGISHEHQAQQNYISTSGEDRDVQIQSELKETEDFEVQTVTLQEIAEHESVGSVSFVQDPSCLSSEPSSNSHIVVSNSDINGEHANKELGNNCVQFEILHHQSTDNIVSTRENFTISADQVIHQSHSQGENLTSVESSVPMYMVAADGGLELVTTAQEDGQTSHENVISSSESQSCT